LCLESQKFRFPASISKQVSVEPPSIATWRQKTPAAQLFWRW
jgi:hypothetical protein